MNACYLPDFIFVLHNGDCFDEYILWSESTQRTLFNRLPTWMVVDGKLTPALPQVVSAVLRISASNAPITRESGHRRAWSGSESSASPCCNLLAIRLPGTKVIHSVHKPD